MKLVRYIVKCLVPPVRKAVVAGIVPLVPSILAFVLQNYGIAALFAATAMASAAGVYKVTNVTAKVPTPVPAP